MADTVVADFLRVAGATAISRAVFGPPILEGAGSPVSRSIAESVPSVRPVA